MHNTLEFLFLEVVLHGNYCSQQYEKKLGIIRSRGFDLKSKALSHGLILFQITWGCYLEFTLKY